MIEENLARLRAHRNNIRRYERLLTTQLSDLERAFIAKRLEEEQAEAEALVKTTFPFSSAGAWATSKRSSVEGRHVRA
ncbi:hypothetical protein [Bradyrhizobium liaoningense]|uniref:hypothetical protein n=1 Tax=Bradyrhizobium liaoningense TaxID=43992 RepID=UPI001BAA8299|nr:hypothetical protein [Bradyrhizobium liaoningense]MBR0718675.1 hypothetical protein [Bradyrhizobium liaoningense]